MNTQEEISKIKKQIRFLTIYSCLISLIIIIALLIKNFRKEDKIQSFTEINVKRINILENDGSPRLVISNMEMSPGPLSYGKTYGIPGKNRAGIIFYNDEATECGGLVFTGRTDTLNDKYFASCHLSFDQYNQNQVLYLQYLDDNGSKTTGLYIDDWQNEPIFPEWRSMYKAAGKLPEGSEKEVKLKRLMEPIEGQPAYAHRVFIGKDTNKSAMINLCDKEGNTRIQLIVDSLGTPKINLLDSDGKIMSGFPQLK